MAAVPEPVARRFLRRRPDPGGRRGRRSAAAHRRHGRSPRRDRARPPALALRRRGGDRPVPRRPRGHRTVPGAGLPPRSLRRRDPARDRDRRGRPGRPPGERRRIQPAHRPARRRPAVRRRETGGLRRPLRAGSGVPAGPLPDRRGAAPGQEPPPQLLVRHRGASQGPVRHEHRRDAGPPGRPHDPLRLRPRHRLPGVLPSHRARREHRAPGARPEPRDRGPGRAGDVARRARGAAANDGAPGGRDPGDRADGQRQDHPPSTRSWPTSTARRSTS